MKDCLWLRDRTVIFSLWRFTYLKGDRYASGSQGSETMMNFAVFVFRRIRCFLVDNCLCWLTLFALGRVSIWCKWFSRWLQVQIKRIYLVPFDFLLLGDGIFGLRMRIEIVIDQIFTFLLDRQHATDGRYVWTGLSHDSTACTLDEWMRKLRVSFYIVRVTWSVLFHDVVNTFPWTWPIKNECDQIRRGWFV